MWWPDLEKSIGAIEKEEAIESAEKNMNQLIESF